MRIAFFHELPRGGARRAINEYARQLKKNHTVNLFIVDEKRESRENKFYSKVFFNKFLPKKWKGNNWKIRLYKDTVELIKLYLLNRKIANVIDENKYDIVLVSASKYIEAPFIMRFLSTPFVFYIHDPYYRIIYDSMLKISKNLDVFRYSYETINRIIRKILDKQNLVRAKLCLGPSKFIANLFSKTYRKKCEVIYYGVDTQVFKPVGIKKDIDVFYIGSGHPIDGYFLVEKLIERTKNLKLNIKCLMTDKEWISNDKDLVNLYQRSKILLATAYREGLGLVPLEAMACGVPVIATNEAGHKETVVDGITGYLLPRDSEVFAKKLDYIFSHPKNLLEMGINARKIMVKDWSWSSRGNQLLGILKKYLSQSS